jgi:RAB protein geranylgeranyltransferase component A
MFRFTIKYFGFLKFVPGLPHLFDAMLKLWTLTFDPKLLDWIDEIEKEVSGWDNVDVSTHKYGGLQLNYGNIELGHIHSNGLLDMLLNRKIKEQLMREYNRVQDHHSFKNSGWISFYMSAYGDKELVLRLFEIAYKLHAGKGISN